jgi:hypothetical protein
MPITYNGVSTGLDVDVTAAIAEPVGSDPPNAALFATPFEKLTNLIQNIQEKAGFLAKARSWTALQTFTAGLVATASAYSNPPIEDTAVLGTDARRLILRARVGTSTMRMRLYRNATNGFELAINAAWDQAGSQWVPDVNGSAILYAWSELAMSSSRKATVVAATPFATWDTAVVQVTSGFTSTAGIEWAHYATTPPAYWKDPDGNVHLEGAVRYIGTTAGQTDLVVHPSFLPAGFRPGPTNLTFGRVFPVATIRTNQAINRVIDYVYLFSDGTLHWRPSDGHSSYNASTDNMLVFLDGIVFRAEA